MLPNNTLAHTLIINTFMSNTLGTHENTTDGITYFECSECASSTYALPVNSDPGLHLGTLFYYGSGRV